MRADQAGATSDDRTKGKRQYEECETTEHSESQIQPCSHRTADYDRVDCLWLFISCEHGSDRDSFERSIHVGFTSSPVCGNLHIAREFPERERRFNTTHAGKPPPVGTKGNVDHVTTKLPCLASRLCLPQADGSIHTRRSQMVCIRAEGNTHYLICVPPDRHAMLTARRVVEPDGRVTVADCHQFSLRAESGRVDRQVSRVPDNLTGIEAVLNREVLVTCSSVPNCQRRLCGRGEPLPIMTESDAATARLLNQLLSTCDVPQNEIPVTINRHQPVTRRVDSDLIHNARRRLLRRTLRP